MLPEARVFWSVWDLRQTLQAETLQEEYQTHHHIEQLHDSVIFALDRAEFAEEQLAALNSFSPLEQLHAKQALQRRLQTEEEALTRRKRLSRQLQVHRERAAIALCRIRMLQSLAPIGELKMDVSEFPSVLKTCEDALQKAAGPSTRTAVSETEAAAGLSLLLPLLYTLRGHDVHLEQLVRPPEEKQEQSDSPRQLAGTEEGAEYARLHSLATELQKRQEVLKVQLQELKDRAGEAERPPPTAAGRVLAQLRVELAQAYEELAKLGGYEAEAAPLPKDNVSPRRAQVLRGRSPRQQDATASRSTTSPRKRSPALRVEEPGGSEGLVSPSAASRWS